MSEKNRLNWGTKLFSKGAETTRFSMKGGELHFFKQKLLLIETV